MNQHGDIAQETETPRDVFGEPQDEASKEQQEAAPEKAPEKKFLSRVVAACWGHLIVFIPHVMPNGIPPRLVCFRRAHLRRPHAVHLDHRAEKDQSGPRMQHARNLPAAQSYGNPETPWGIERQTGQHKIDVGKSRGPVRQALVKLVPENAAVRKYLSGSAHDFAPPAFVSSSSRSLGPNRR